MEDALAQTRHRPEPQAFGEEVTHSAGNGVPEIIETEVVQTLGLDPALGRCPNRTETKHPCPSAVGRGEQHQVRHLLGDLLPPEGKRATEQLKLRIGLRNPARIERVPPDVGCLERLRTVVEIRRSAKTRVADELKAFAQHLLLGLAPGRQTRLAPQRVVVVKQIRSGDARGKGHHRDRGPGGIEVRLPQGTVIAIVVIQQPLGPIPISVGMRSDRHRARERDIAAGIDERREHGLEQTLGPGQPSLGGLAPNLDDVGLGSACEQRVAGFAKLAEEPLLGLLDLDPVFDLALGHAVKVGADMLGDRARSLDDPVPHTLDRVHQALAPDLGLRLVILNAPVNAAPPRLRRLGAGGKRLLGTGLEIHQHIGELPARGGPAGLPAQGRRPGTPIAVLGIVQHLPQGRDHQAGMRGDQKHRACRDHPVLDIATDPIPERTGQIHIGLDQRLDASPDRSTRVGAELQHRVDRTIARTGILFGTLAKARFQAHGTLRVPLFHLLGERLGLARHPVPAVLQILEIDLARTHVLGKDCPIGMTVAGQRLGGNRTQTHRNVGQERERACGGERLGLGRVGGRRNAVLAGLRLIAERGVPPVARSVENTHGASLDGTKR